MDSQVAATLSKICISIYEIIEICQISKKVILIHRNTAHRSIGSDSISSDRIESSKGEQTAH